jgi:hypothetical protein
MSNWEPEEVSDADMEDIAGGTKSDPDAKKKMMKKKENAGSDPFPGSDPVDKKPSPGGDGKK